MYVELFYTSCNILILIRYIT